MFKPKKKSRQPSISKRTGLLEYPPALFAFLIGMALTLFLYAQTQRLELRAAEVGLQQIADDVRDALETGIQNNLSSLIAMRSFFAANREVSSLEFGVFSEHLLTRFTEIEALQWVPRVISREKAEYEAGMRREGLRGPAIFSRNVMGAPIPLKRKNEYFPVKYSEPAAFNRSALGFDQSSDPDHLSAMIRARESEELSATKIIRIYRTRASESAPFLGFVAYMPVFKSDSSKSHAPRPPQMLLGYVAVVFRAEELVKALLVRMKPTGADVRISAESARDGARVGLYQSELRHVTGLARGADFNVAGCHWSVRCVKPLDPLGPGRRTSLIVLLTGLLSSTLLAVTLTSFERKKNQTLMLELSVTDELTGLYNRRGFMLLADEQFKLAKRNKAGFWIIATDLDGLKRINDTYGHAEGDRAIASAAAIMKKSMRDSDIIARFGGDEFVAIVIEAKPDQGRTIVRNIREKLAGEGRSATGAYHVSLSIGAVYANAQEELELEMWLKRVDEALYEDKNLRKKSGERK